MECRPMFKQCYCQVTSTTNSQIFISDVHPHLFTNHILLFNLIYLHY